MRLKRPSSEKIAISSLCLKSDHIVSSNDKVEYDGKDSEAENLHKSSVRDASEGIKTSNESKLSTSLVTQPPIIKIHLPRHKKALKLNKFRLKGEIQTSIRSDLSSRRSIL